MTRGKGEAGTCHLALPGSRWTEATEGGGEGNPARRGHRAMLTAPRLAGGVGCGGSGGLRRRPGRHHAASALPAEIMEEHTKENSFAWRGRRRARARGCRAWCPAGGLAGHRHPGAARWAGGWRPPRAPARGRTWSSRSSPSSAACASATSARAALPAASWARAARGQQDAARHRVGSLKNHQEVDMNVVKICFQASYQNQQGQMRHMDPVLSEPIYNKSEWRPLSRGPCAGTDTQAVASS
nr:uncharacterized protein LOC103345903 isoform X9 [Oryctolagus cuniculus]